MLSFFQSLYILGVALCTVTAYDTCKTTYNKYNYHDGLCVPHQKCSYAKQHLSHYSTEIERKHYFSSTRCNEFSEYGGYRGYRGYDQWMCCLQDFVKHSRYELSLNDKGVKMLGRQECGLNNEGNRVANAENATLGEFPWMALLRYGTGNLRNKFQCGGSLITNRFVLTAAHCVVNTENQLTGVLLGEHDFSKREWEDCIGIGRKRRCKKLRYFGIGKSYPHPLYAETKINDVALIQLSRQVEPTEFIKPICLPIKESMTDLLSIQRFTIAGWGLTEHGATTLLQKAVLQFVNPDRCLNTFRLSYRSDSHMCVGGTSNVSTCKGDSGGPFFARVPYTVNRYYRTVQYGIVSHGTGCGLNNGVPGLHTNVIQFMPWITKTLAENDY